MGSHLDEEWFEWGDHPTTLFLCGGAEKLDLVREKVSYGTGRLDELVVERECSSLHLTMILLLFFLHQARAAAYWHMSTWPLSAMDIFFSKMSSSEETKSRHLQPTNFILVFLFCWVVCRPRDSLARLFFRRKFVRIEGLFSQSCDLIGKGEGHAER